MKLRLSKWISNNWPIFILVVFEIILAWKNIIPRTWLTGWDSTQPELNLKLNLVRSLTSAWQEYRGLGLTDGMAHAANIVHLFYVWVLSLVIPHNLVRYVFVFLSHLVGGIGMYKLLQYLLKKSKTLALAGAIFYLLNPITIQMFYQPLELFIIHFAGLPWLVLTLMKYLEDGGRKNLMWLFIVLLVFVSQNHVPTIFIVTMMGVGIILLTALVGSTGKNWKKILAVMGVVIGVNSFWLLPYMVTTMNNAQVIPQAKMNLLSNSEVILRNAAYGDLASIVRMQGFSLNYEDWHTDGPMELQMPQWGSWWESASVQVIMWVVFGLAIIGIMKSVWKRDWKMVAIGLVWVLALFNLGVRIPGIEQVMNWVYENVPLYGAVFRFAFTKFAIIFAFMSTVLAIYALDALVRKWGKVVVSLVVVGASLWIGWPVFSGNFLYKELRVNLPNEYQKLFNDFDETEVGRVARLPAYDLWGWESNNWGYRGSGIVWQGVRSPMLLRSFDPWSLYNETFYNEFSTALYAGELRGVEGVLDKYDVRYVLLDESVIAPGQDRGILRIEETKRLAEDLGWVEKFREGFLTVWDLENSQITNDKFSNGEQGFISAPGNYSYANGDMEKVRKDVIYGDVGTYVEVQGTVVYPFANLMREEVRGIEYEKQGTKLIINQKFPARSAYSTAVAGGSNSQIQIPGWKVGDIVRIEYRDGEPMPAYYVNDQSGPIFLGKEKPEEGMNIIYARISEGEEWREYTQDARFQILDSSIKIEVPSEPQIYDFGTEGQGTSGNCDVLKRGYATKLQIINSQILKLGQAQYVADQRGAACDYVVMAQLDTRLSYLMRVQGDNAEGRSLKFFLYNTGSKRNDIEYLLGKDKFDQTFSLLPWAWDGYYTLNIETRSFGQRTENLIDPVEVRWFPVEQIAGARIITNPKFSNSPIGNNLQIAEVTKTGTWMYRVKVEGSGLLKLSQGYDEGWVGVQITNHKFSNSQILKHVKVDGWSNGWIVGKSQITNDKFSNGEAEIYIFYWPQLLEYIGFALLGLTAILLSK